MSTLPGPWRCPGSSRAARRTTGAAHLRTGVREARRCHALRRQSASRGVAPVPFAASIFHGTGGHHMQTREHARTRTAAWPLYALLGALTSLATLAAWSPPGPAAAAPPAPKVYVSNFKDNTVSVIDTAAGTVVATIPVAAGPHGMSVTPDGHTVYVSGDGSSEVTVIDAATNRVARTISVGKTPHGLAMAPDGK